MTVKFTVMGDPVPKARAKVFTTKNGITRGVTPQRTVDYEELIKWEYKRQCNKVFDFVPICVWVRAFSHIPKTYHKKKVTPQMREDMINGVERPLKDPDTDNIYKTAADALNKLAYRDDCQNVEIHGFHFFGEVPRLEVIVTTNLISLAELDEVFRKAGEDELHSVNK